MSLSWLTPPATNEEFTNNLLRRPKGASQDWLEQHDRLRSLFDHLAHHEAMVATGNLAQKFQDPPRSKNRVYFLWESVGKTLETLFKIDPAKTSAQWNWGDKELLESVTVSSTIDARLILDYNPGFLNDLMERAYPGQNGEHPDFGDEIFADARNILRK